ncbi:MAG: hemolysin family protein [Planctomycetota bacterium]
MKNRTRLFFFFAIALMATTSSLPAAGVTTVIEHSGPDITFNLLTIIFLIIITGFFVAAEYALIRARWTRIETLVAGGHPTAKVVKHAMEHLPTYLSATQIGITLASLILGWRGEPFVAEYIFLPLLNMILSPNVAQIWSHGFAITIALILITYLHVVLGELIPRSLALQYPEKLALYIVRPMRFFVFLFHPLIWLLNGTTNRILKVFNLRPSDAHSLALSEEELMLLVAESKKAGVVSEDEQRMLLRVFKFHNKTVREIMKPQPDIIALEIRAGEQAIRTAFEHGYSRLPVYENNLSNIKGIIYVKDLMYTLQNPKLIKLVDLLREALFVPESKAVSMLLREFQRSKMHIAIVVDEFGETAGLVTLEDVIEELVGEIQDEYDVEPAEVERATDGVFIFDGKAGLSRLKEIFPTYELPEGQFETVAGLVYHLAGRVPKETDILHYGNLSFRVTKREGRRLRKIAVSRESLVASANSTASDATIASVAPPDNTLSVDGKTPTGRYEAILDEINVSEDRVKNAKHNFGP